MGKLSNYVREHGFPPDKSVVNIEESLPCTKVLTRLYLGGYQCSENREFMTTTKIKAVMNCTKSLANTFLCDTKLGIEYLRIPVNDSLKDLDINKMTKLMDLAAEFIHKHIDVLKKNILVHCVQGRQRSAACVVAYLMKYRGLSPEQACGYVMSKRHEAFRYGTSLNFEKSIVSYYRKLHTK